MQKFPQFPRPRIASHSEAKPYDSYVYTWLLRVGLMMQNDLYRQALPLLDMDALASQLMNAATKARPQTFIHPMDGKPSKGQRSTEKLERDCDHAAARVMEYWDANYTAKMSEWGKKSKRPQTFTVAQVLDYPNLSIHEAALALGCSDRTVARRRAQHRAEVAAQDALFEAWLDAPAGTEFPTELLHVYA